MGTRHDQYSQIADKYDQSFKQMPFREYLEAFTAFRLLGDIGGLAILELACGTGLYTRALRRHGAARVLGVDISDEMIRVARSYEEESPLGIEYLVQDVAALGQIGQFDAAVAIYLLNYASSAENLLHMAQGIARNLKPGTRFISFHLNPDIDRAPGYYRKYGVDVYIDDAMHDADPVYFSLIMGDIETPKLTAYYWSLAALRSAFEQAGFVDIHWITPEVSAQGIEAHGSELWQDYLRSPHSIFLECTKA